MRTTLDIATPILLRAKELARTEHTTLRRRTDEGLQMAIDNHEARRPRKVKPVVFMGKGLDPAYQGAAWSAVSDEAYRGRGTTPASRRHVCFMV